MLGLGTFKKVKMMHEKLTLFLITANVVGVRKIMKRSKILEIHL